MLAGLVLILVVWLGAASPPAERSLVPIRVGDGPAFRPASLWSATRRGVAVGSLRCGRHDGPRSGVHIELFARGRVVIVPAGVGIAPPRRKDGAYVDGGRCHYPIRTREPTGVLEIVPGTDATLGQFFELWGQPLSRDRLAGFDGSVRVDVGGRRWPGRPADVPLRRHAQIVVQVGPMIPAHRAYMFAPGL